jgi:hypothetical protein
MFKKIYGLDYINIKISKYSKKLPGENRKRYFKTFKKSKVEKITNRNERF